MAGRWQVVVVISAVAAAAAARELSEGRGRAREPPAGERPTYSKDVAPIVQKNCQVCHRPGEAGPFALLTYEDARHSRPRSRNAVVANAAMVCRSPLRQVLEQHEPERVEDRDDRQMGRRRSAARRSARPAEAGGMGRRLGHRQAGHDFRAAAALRCPGARCRRLSARRRADALH